MSDIETLIALASRVALSLQAWSAEEEYLAERAKTHSHLQALAIAIEATADEVETALHNLSIAHGALAHRMLTEEGRIQNALNAAEATLKHAWSEATEFVQAVTQELTVLDDFSQRTAHLASGFEATLAQNCGAIESAKEDLADAAAEQAGKLTDAADAAARALEGLGQKAEIVFSDAIAVTETACHVMGDALERGADGLITTGERVATDLAVPLETALAQASAKARETIRGAGRQVASVVEDMTRTTEAGSGPVGASARQLIDDVEAAGQLLGEVGQEAAQVPIRVIEKITSLGFG